MSIALTLAAFAVIGAAVAALLYALRVISKLQAADVEDKKVYERLVTCDKDLTYWKDRSASLAGLLEEKSRELLGETEARRRTEAHRDELLQALLAAGDPKAIGKTIQNELAALGGKP